KKKSGGGGGVVVVLWCCCGAVVVVWCCSGGGVVLWWLLFGSGVLVVNMENYENEHVTLTYRSKLKLIKLIITKFSNTRREELFMSTREEFCLIKGLRFGSEFSERYEVRLIPFKRLLFDSDTDGGHITCQMLVDNINGEEFDNLHDETWIFETYNVGALRYYTHQQRYPRAVARPTLEYFKVFGSKCFILNTKDYLTKFDLKSHEGVFLGYSQSSKAYIILNKHTMKVEESLNVALDGSPPFTKLSPLVDDDVGTQPLSHTTTATTIAHHSSHNQASNRLIELGGGAATFVVFTYERGEAWHSGIYVTYNRDFFDWPISTKRNMKSFIMGLIENLDRDLLYAMRVEGKMDVEFVSNYDQVKNAIMEKVIVLRDELTQEESPLIYHLDVAIMYPIIILTNRLQDLNYCYKTLRVNHNESSKSRQLVCYFGSKDMRAHLWIQRITN
nr:DNA polymerase epsilon catalytic subunit A-like [Tanacetum cinerariifolium]